MDHGFLLEQKIVKDLSIYAKGLFKERYREVGILIDASILVYFCTVALPPFYKLFFVPVYLFRSSCEQ